MIVSEEHANRSGTLHGGMTATLVDQISTLALTTVDESGDENMQRGVSVDMSISFLRPAKIGETIEVTANILKKGRTLAFLDVNICDKNSGKLIAKGNHTKYL
ncbi:acyl-coenzyme A thioesterase 13-like isoform X2 [Dinothrombium tinctorium]|uniref:Acyl-coenzyme A thioesterase 13 n=1 Tax=Dinothrombium tinctorium TaxID=1965070 RepID=A0A3S3QU96_9ACAR|nr:acyl-coenzyme A thioesterase 13-like isoform X2 [Dinothrombium tinctorium]